METESEALECGLCRKRFVRAPQLQNHMRYHRAVRRFPCALCPKSFSQSNNLRTHLRIHTNERPFKCVDCGKAFTQVTNLNNHVRLHTGERPYVCDVPGCAKAFAQVTNLNNHRRSHQKDGIELREEPPKKRGRQPSARNSSSSGAAAPFACPLCGERFPDEKAFVAHSCERGDALLKIPEYFPEEARTCPFDGCRRRFGTILEFHNHLLKEHDTTGRHSKCASLVEMTNVGYGFVLPDYVTGSAAERDRTRRYVGSVFTRGRFFEAGVCIK